MTDTTNQITFVPGFLGGSYALYRTGLGILTAYPQATGTYWSCLCQSRLNRTASSCPEFAPN
jgi:hypothetical protein